MVLGVGGDGAGLAVLLQSAEDVGESLCAGNGPVAASGLFVTLVGSPGVLHFGTDVGRIDGRIFGELRQLPCRGAVCHESVRQQHDGSHVLQRYLGCRVGAFEAVGRRGGCEHRHGAFAVTSEEHLQQVGLFGLGGQTCSRTTTLYVEYHQGQLHDDSQVHGFRFQADARTGSGSDGKRACKGGSDSGCAAGNLVLALHGHYAQ